MFLNEFSMFLNAVSNGAKIFSEMRDKSRMLRDNKGEMYVSWLNG
jgi:hypothetical protein